MEICAHPPGWYAVGEFCVSSAHDVTVLLCGQRALTDCMNGFVALLCWFQSKFVSARPIALASNLLIDDKVGESSILVGDIPLQF